MSDTKKKSSARQRIIETGERLFYAEGIRAVGIDRIIAEAKVAKMTLYNHFASKDDLILAVLQYRDEKINCYFETSMRKYIEQGEDALSAFFSTLKQWFSESGFRGCAFINAAVELADAAHPGAIFSAEHKRTFQKMITEAVEKVAGPGTEEVAIAIGVLVEGAIVTAVMEGKPDAADVARKAASQLLGEKMKV